MVSHCSQQCRRVQLDSESVECDHPASSEAGRDRGIRAKKKRGAADLYGAKELWYQATWCQLLYEDQAQVSASHMAANERSCCERDGFKAERAP